MVLTSQANETAQPQQIKLVSSIAANTLGTTAKTITLAQAQQMGLLTSSKVQQIVPQSPTKTTTVNKTIQGKTIKVVPNVKSPTKILPAPVQGQKVQTTKGAQRVIIRQGTQIKGGTIVGSGMNQVIRIPASQTINPGQIHQVNIPGKGVQYIRFMTATTTPSNSTSTNSVSTVKTITQTTSTTQKAQVVPVASIAVSRQNVAKTTSTTAGSNVIKVLPMNTTQTRPVAPKPTSGQRILIPAANTVSRTGQPLASISASALSQIQGIIYNIPNNLLSCLIFLINFRSNFAFR